MIVIFCTSQEYQHLADNNHKRISITRSNAQNHTSTNTRARIRAIHMATDTHTPQLFPVVLIVLSRSDLQQIGMSPAIR